MYVSISMCIFAYTYIHIHTCIFNLSIPLCMSKFVRHRYLHPVQVHIHWCRSISTCISAHTYLSCKSTCISLAKTILNPQLYLHVYADLNLILHPVSHAHLDISTSKGRSVSTSVSITLYITNIVEEVVS